MFQGIFKSAINDANKNYIFGTGSIPIQIKIANLETFADGTTKQQGYQVAEVNKLISTMLTGWSADGNKPKSMSDNYLELILSCDNGFVVKKRLQFPHIITWQDDNTQYNIADVYKPFIIDNWLKADDFENPDITLVVEPTDEILTTSTATPPEVTTTNSGRFYLYYRNLPVGVNRVHIDFHIKTKTEPIDFDLEVIDGMSWKDAQVILASNEQAKKNVLLSGVKDVYKFTGAEGNFENITMHEWSALYQQIISLNPNNKFTHDIYFVIYKDKEGELTKRVNSMEPSVNKYLINKTSKIDVVEDITSEYTITKGSQAYGNVGSAISIDAQSILEYVAIDTEGVIVEFMSEKWEIDVSSYLQYVDSNGIILERDFINIGVGVACETTIIFPESAVRAYVTGSKGTIRIFRTSSVLVSQFEEIKHKMDNLPAVGRLKDITIADNPDSIVDAINKGCTLSMDKLILNKQEIFAKWGVTSANNMFITGTVGSKISLIKSYDIRNIKIPVKDGDIITYPMFRTSESNGSFLIDSNNIVLEAFTNSTEPDGTLGTVEVNGYGSKEVYFYMSLYPYSLITQSIILKNANSEYAEIPINKYLLELLSNDYKTNVSENKALTTTGALRLYEELSDKIKRNNLLLFPCKDYGVMPSCLQGDSGAFLQDGVDSEGNAIIKYADVIAKYDELVTAYPGYINKKELGFDASGTIPMYAYSLEPKYPTQSIYLQAGVHGWEPDPIFALAMITTLIANAYGTTNGDGLIVDDNALKFIRENVKVTIVPCVNPYGFNNRADCGIDKRAQAQNNSKGINLNAAWNSNNSNAAEAIAVRTLIESIKDELSFAIDMHSTVWVDSRSRYGCFYGGVNEGSASLLTAFKTYEWLYKFYNIKYPSIVQGDSVPNILDDGYASIGTMTGVFNSWIYSTYGIESTTMEFSDHVWTPELHTSVAMSVAVNMYLNQFIQHICARFKTITPNVENTDIYPAKG